MNSMSQLPNEPIVQSPNDRGHAERSAGPALDEPKSSLRRLAWRALLLVVVGLFAFGGLLMFSVASPTVATFLVSSCAASPARSCTTTASQNWVQPSQECTGGHWQWHDGYQQCYPGYWQWHGGYNSCTPGHWEWSPGHQECYGGHWESGWSCDDWGCWQENNWVDGGCDWVSGGSNWVDGGCDWVSGYNEWVDGGCDWISGYNEWIPQTCSTPPGYYETVYTEVCDINPGCTGTCPATQTLHCNGVAVAGGCGAGANCWCDVNDVFAGGTCNSASDCGGQSFNCPYSQLGGATWSCQSHQCISICGDNGNNNNNNNGDPMSVPPTSVPPTSTPVPTSTPIPTPTRTPFPIPTPIPQPHCPPNPEDLGGSVTSVIPPGAPVVQFASAPTYPVVVGQDAAQRGADLTTQISVGACTINWHYRVLEDYVYCGPNKPVCDCTKDDCELRQRWKEWDDTCTENYPLAGVTIDGKLSQDSVNYINGPLQQKYPGVKVYQGALRFFPSPLAAQTEYTIGNPTIWGMAGQKYPLQDPGGWDITVNVATQQTAHCSALQWSLPFPKWLTVYFRDQTLTK